MKKVMYILVLVGSAGMLGACAHTPCNNDYCYNRELSSMDGYEEGEVAAWGSEKYQRMKERRVRKEFQP